MNTRTIQAALKLLAANRIANPNRRVATRWLVANMMLQYDIMIRLQFLEGVAHVPAGTWTRQGKLALPRVQKHFENQAVQNEWFDAGNTGMFKILYGSLRSVINRFPIIHGTDPYEIIDGALAGLGTGTDFAADRVMPVYETGAFLKVKVIKGEETPETVAKGILAKHLVRRVLTLAKQTKEDQMGVDEKGVEVEVRDPGSSVSAVDFLASMLFTKNPDPLAKSLQDLLADTWASSAPMTMWLEEARRTGEIPKGQDIAMMAGITPQTFSQRHFKPAWFKFGQALYANKALYRALETRLIQEGVQDELPEAFAEFVRSDRMASANHSGQVLRILVGSYLPVFFARFAGKKIR